MTDSYRPDPQFKLGSSYGSRIDPFTRIPGRFHSGQDFPAPVGTPVPTAASGDTPPPSPASPLLGIFSGKPMPNWPVPPPIFQPEDQSSPDEDELYQRWRRWLDA